MSGGRLIAVVGPSGVGKDSVMAGICAAMPDINLVRRTITRAAELGGEDFDAVSPDVFRDMAKQGAFCLHWGAHDLLYGVPVTAQADVQKGATCLANLSRGVLIEASQAFPTLIVLQITASAQTLAARLSGRGRETTAEIEKRLLQAVKPLPAGLNVISVSNDGALDDTVLAAVEALRKQEVTCGAH